jgi:hypothetical protein
MSDKSIARHTQAPWEVIRELDEDSASETSFVTQIGPFHIEWHDDLNKGNPERIEADIALASAAPKLLAALQRLIAIDDAHATLHAPDGDDVARMIEHAEAHKFAREVLAKVAQ